MPTTTTEFERLMQRVKDGCPEATREVYERFGGYVRRAVRFVLDRRLRRMYSERDLEQSVWLSFFKDLRKRGPFAGPEELQRFLCKMARNKGIDANRHQLGTAKHDVTRELPLDSPCGPNSDGPGLADRLPGHEDTPSTGARLKELLEGLQRGLPPRDRQVLELLGQGYTYAEVEARTGVNPKKIQRLLRERQLNLVRELLRQGYTYSEIEALLGGRAK
jgi:RNA polymerase sigma factor (sigma-70 family)